MQKLNHLTVVNNIVTIQEQLSLLLILQIYKHTEKN